MIIGTRCQRLCSPEFSILWTVWAGVARVRLLESPVHFYTALIQVSIYPPKLKLARQLRAEEEVACGLFQRISVIGAFRFPVHFFLRRCKLMTQRACHVPFKSVLDVRPFFMITILQWRSESYRMQTQKSISCTSETFHFVQKYPSLSWRIIPFGDD